jgi:hypothetical protein
VDSPPPRRLKVIVSTANGGPHSNQAVGMADYTVKRFDEMEPILDGCSVARGPSWV